MFHNRTITPPRSVILSFELLTKWLQCVSAHLIKVIQSSFCYSFWGFASHPHPKIGAVGDKLRTSNNVPLSREISSWSSYKNKTKNENINLFDAPDGVKRECSTQNNCWQYIFCFELSINLFQRAIIMGLTKTPGQPKGAGGGTNLKQTFSPMFWNFHFVFIAFYLKKIITFIKRKIKTYLLIQYVYR